MYARDYNDMLTGLVKKYCGPSAQVQYTDDLAGWCEGLGLSAPDTHATMCLAGTKEGSISLAVVDLMPEEAVAEKIRALGIRWALQDVANNMADRLDSDKKRLAYLFLKEYAGTKPELDDELVADNWINDELHKQGLFRE